MRIASLWVLCIALCIALFSQGANAQTGEVRCPAVKTQLKNSIGGALESLGDIGGSICRFKNLANGQTYERIIGVFDPSSPGGQANIGKIRSLIPLRVGNSVSWSGSGADSLGSNSGVWHFTTTIEKYELVKIAAGTIPCFVILQVEQTHGTGGRWERRWWYSPLIGYTVKFEFKTIHGNPPKNYPKDWELVESRQP